MKALVVKYEPSMRDEVVNLKLRSSDVEELRAAAGKEAKESLAENIDAATIVNVIKLNDKIIGVFGVTAHPEANGVGIPWLLATDSLSEICKQFVVECKAMLGKFHDEFPVLTNFVDTRNEVSIKWLEWLGFEVEEEEHFLHDPQVPFFLFARVKSPEDYV